MLVMNQARSDAAVTLEILYKHITTNLSAKTPRTAYGASSDPYGLLRQPRSASHDYEA